MGRSQDGGESVCGERVVRAAKARYITKSGWAVIALINAIMILMAQDGCHKDEKRWEDLPDTVAAICLSP